MGQFRKAKVNFKFKCNVFKATVLGALLSGLCAFGRQSGSFTEGELNQLEACQNKLARRLLAQTRRAWDTEPKDGRVSTKELHRKLGMVTIETELSICSLGWAKRVAEQIQKDGLANQQVLVAIFGQTHVDNYQYPGMTEDGKLTPYATPWAKQFQDDINAQSRIRRRRRFCARVEWRLEKSYPAVRWRSLCDRFVRDSSKVLERQLMNARIFSQRTRRINEDAGQERVRDAWNFLKRTKQD